MTTPPIGLYVHVPFCSRRCDYCDFFVVVAGGSDPSGDFFGWIERDLDRGAAPPDGAAIRADTLYFGGGTPSLAPPEGIARVTARARSLFGLPDGAEVTLEANPETVTADRVRAWREAGINRLSLGVQSLADRVLRPRGRVYTGDEAIGAARAAREAGAENIGVDLIAGLPGETPASFAEGLERILDFGPDHLSIYLIETRESGKDTPLARAVEEGRETLPADEEIVDTYHRAAERLVADGYRHYEISNFARPGFESRHNLKYWTSSPYLGVGPSAHSLIGGRRFSRPADLSGWIEWLRSGGAVPPGSDYTLESAAARAREALTLRLRLLEGVETESFSARWGVDLDADLGREIDALVDDGLLARRPGAIALTRRGLLLSNEAFARIL